MQQWKRWFLQKQLFCEQEVRIIPIECKFFSHEPLRNNLKDVEREPIFIPQVGKTKDSGHLGIDLECYTDVTFVLSDRSAGIVELHK